jgi:hypothetical protein
MWRFDKVFSDFSKQGENAQKLVKVKTLILIIILIQVPKNKHLRMFHHFRSSEPSITQEALEITLSDVKSQKLHTRMVH